VIYDYSNGQKWIGEMLKLTPPSTESPDKTSHDALLEATTYDPKSKENSNH
jgi:hypothetical protein